MIRDERTAATGGRTINPFWVTGSTVKPEICIPFPIFFFLLSLPSFFCYSSPFIFRWQRFNRYSKGKSQRGNDEGGTHARPSVLFLQNPPEREALRSRACESWQRERGWWHRDTESGDGTRRGMEQNFEARRVMIYFYRIYRADCIFREFIKGSDADV